MSSRPLVMVSNRGPLSFSLDDGELVARRGAGGLVSGIGPLLSGSDAIWIASAISEGDRAAAAQGTVRSEDFVVRMLAVDPGDYALAYDVVCNAAMWFVHHDLFDRSRRPNFDGRFRDAWDAYRRVNRAFAELIADSSPPDATVAVQDYHLALQGEMLAGLRPDLHTVHFSHTPFAGPDSLRVLPTSMVEELLSGMAGHAACGFHTARWADGFTASCDAFIGRRPSAFVSPLAPDPDDLAQVAAGEAGTREHRTLCELVGDRLVIGRSDRIELSKNLVRGFLAYEHLLHINPDWHDRVVFVASVYPSREGLAEYLAYRQEVYTVCTRINERFGNEHWQPIHLDTSDNFPASVAVMRRADVLLVNPIRDGLNLVAMEGPLVNDRNAVLALSGEAGAWQLLSDVALEVHPFDVVGTAEVLDRALRMDASERGTRFGALLAKVKERSPADWLADQLAH